MSQDIFEDLLKRTSEGDGSESETPIEFSGVSASGSSGQPSPASQPRASTSRLLPKSPLAVIPSEPVASTSKMPQNPQVFVCSVCRRKLKTLKGIKQHMERHGVPYTDPSSSVSNEKPTHESVPLSSTQQTDVSIRTANQQAQTASFPCTDCRTVLKTKAGFLKHRAAHKMTDANRRKPLATDFKGEILEHTVDSIIQEMLAEPNYGDLSLNKIKFLQEFLTKKNSEEWLIFMSCFQEICVMVCEKQTKILPMNQFEESKRKLNVFLNENHVSLSEKLMGVCEEPIPLSLAGRLLFRFASKFLDKVQSWIAKEMLPTAGSANDVPDCSPMQLFSNEREEKKFLESLGNIFRAFYKKGIRSQSKLWQIQSACLKEAFVDGHDAISTSSFLCKSNWFSGDENCIVPSAHATNFFKAVEMEVRRSDESEQLQNIIERVLVNREALDDWFFLTNAHFSESQSLLFMRELISTFVKSSRLLEEKKRNRAEEKTVQATTVALRGHLQRNYVEKKDGCSEDIQ